MSVFNIKDYSDVQSAIDACGKAGGGTVLIPSGTYRIGTIKLYSNMVLHLEAGAVLIGPDSIEDYTRYDFPWELYKFTLPLIYAEYAQNIQITGKGKIDFNGRKFARKDKICIADDIPADSIPVSNITPMIFGIRFMLAQIITRLGSGISGYTRFTSNAAIMAKKSRANNPNAAIRELFRITCSDFAI